MKFRITDDTKAYPYSYTRFDIPEDITQQINIAAYAKNRHEHTTEKDIAEISIY